MEGNAPKLLEFSEFYSEFSNCLQLQEWKLVNNLPLSNILRNSPELFLDYLIQIISSISKKI